MTSRVRTISASATIREAANLMHDHDTGILPVTDHGLVCGVLTDRDIVVRALARGSDPGHTPVSAVMTSDISYLREDNDITDAARLMTAKQRRRLVIVNLKGKPVGIVSLGDLARRQSSRELVGNVLTEVSKSR